MEVKNFIDQSIKCINLSTEEILKNHNFLEAIIDFEYKSNILFDEFKYLNPKEQNNFLKGISKILPLSQKIFSIFIEKADDKDDIKSWLLESNKIYIENLENSIGGGEFEDSFDEIDDEIIELEEKIEGVENNYLINVKKRSTLRDDLESKNRQNNQLLNEIESLDNEIISIEHSKHSNITKIDSLKKQIVSLEDDISKTTQEITQFESKKSDLQTKLNSLIKQNQQNDQLLNDIKKETEELIAKDKKFQEQKERLDKYRESYIKVDRYRERIKEDFVSANSDDFKYAKKELEDIQTRLKEVEKKYLSQTNEQVIVDDILGGKYKS